ncbi:MAG: tetratricopeptide repeat protein [Methylococcales bacterium]|nr:tetratricopeptide repeat protein [Methylococcales bacterium]
MSGVILKEQAVHADELPNRVDLGAVTPALIGLMLKQREQVILTELQRVEGGDRHHIAVLEKQASDIQCKLHNMEVALADCKKMLAAAHAALERLGQRLPAPALQQALKALLAGRTEPAEQLFAAVRARQGDQAAEAAFHLAELAYNRIDYAAAFRLYCEAVDLQPDNPLYNNEAGYLAKTIGRYHDAETLYLRALAIWERTVGAEHGDVANSLNNLAGLYLAQGLYARAEPLYRRALDIREKLLGTAHPEVAVSVTNLGLLHVSLSRYAKAEQFYLRALAIREESLGEGHFDVAVSLGHLAGLYKTQGAYAKAEQCFQRALRICEQAVGPDHPCIATLLNSLAGLYKAQRAYAKAERLYHRALVINMHVLGEDHPHVEAGMVNYASLRRMLNRLPDTEG